MSLVHVADIETPNKPTQQQQQEENQYPSSSSPVESSPSVKAKRRVSLFAPGDAEATNNQAQAVLPVDTAFSTADADLADIKRRGRQSIAVAPSTPRQEPLGAPQTEPRDHRIMAANMSLLFSGNGAVEMLHGEKEANMGSPGSLSSPTPGQEDSAHDEVIDQVVVLDDHDEEENGARGHARSDVENATQGLGIESPSSNSSPSKLSRRSSILDRVWPFGGGGSFSSPVATQPLPIEEPVDAAVEKQAYENDRASEARSNTSLEDEAEVEGAEDLLPPLQSGEGPRLPRSMSSPGRLSSSPSFLPDGRRKVSLRTRTLLKSSAALAERLEAEAELGPQTIVEQQEPTGHFEQLAEPFALRSEQEPRDMPATQEHSNYATEGVAQSRTGDEDTDEDEVDRSLTASQDQVPDLLSQSRPSAYKRMSLPASSNAARRFSLFGGLPKLRSSSEAEDVVDSTRAERMGHARRKSSFEPSAMNGDLLRAPRDPSLSEATYEQLRPQARDALRYLLSKKPTTVASPKPEEQGTTPTTAMSPVLPMSSLGSAASPATGSVPATPKYGALRELRLGRADAGDLLEQARSTAAKRRSLILSPQVSSNAPLHASTPPAVSSPVMRSSVTLEESPDVVFLKQAMRMSEVDIEGDTYVKALRHLFRGHSALLARDTTGYESAADVDGLVTLLGSPAAHRALLAAAASVGRLSPQESAIQAAALTHAKHKKTRRGCRGGRRRSKSHNAAAGEGDDQVDTGADLAAPLESLDLNGQDEEPDSAAVQRVQEIQHLLDRLGPLAPSGFHGQTADPFAARHARRQSMGVPPVTAAAEPIAEVAEESMSAPSPPRKSFAAHDTSYDEVETDAEGEQQASEQRNHRKSTTGGSRSGMHRRGASTASNMSNGSRAAGKAKGAGEDSTESRERDEAASVTGSEDSHGSGRQRSGRTNAGKGSGDNGKPANVRSSSRRSTARVPFAEHDGTSATTKEDDNRTARNGRVPRGPPPPPSIAKLTGGGGGGNTGRHTRGRSTVSAEDPASPVRTRGSAPDDVQTSPVKASGGGGRGKKAGSSSTAGTKAAGGRKPPSRRTAHAASDAASSDFPGAPESEPAYGSGGPTTRLRSGRVVGSGLR